ncbi:hypothetical protein EMIT0111MI5_80252 [Burkholderia sp. IT-111MI5]
MLVIAFGPHVLAAAFPSPPRNAHSTAWSFVIDASHTFPFAVACNVIGLSMDGEYMRPGAAPWEDASHASVPSLTTVSLTSSRH